MLFVSKAEKDADDIGMFAHGQYLAFCDCIFSLLFLFQVFLFDDLGRILVLGGLVSGYDNLGG